MNELRTIINLVLQLMKRSFQDKYFQQRAQIVPGRQKPRIRNPLTIGFQEYGRSLPLPQTGKSAQVLQLTHSLAGMMDKPRPGCVTERTQHPCHICQRGSLGPSFRR